MKKQVKLTQSDLYNVIKESVKKVILEFGTDKGELGDKNRTLMAMAAKRGLENNDSTIYDNAYQSITQGGTKDGLTRDETIGVLNDFQKKFEDFNEQPANDLAANEGRMTFKVNETQLKAIIREAVDTLLEKFGGTQLGQYQLGRLVARKKQQGDEEGYKNVVNNAKLQCGADRGVGTNQNAFGNGFHIGKDNVKHGYDLAKKGKL